MNRIRRIHRLVIHKPGITVGILLPISGQAANDIPVEAITSRLYQAIQWDFERAPKRRSRGPYVLGPISEPEKRVSGVVPGIGELWPRNMVVYVAHADVYQGQS